MSLSTTAILLSAHGTVESVDDIPAFLKNIRRGRPTPPEIEQEIRSRFTAVGGSPLLRNTREVAGMLEKRLGVPVFVAMRLWHPYYDEVLEDIAAQGIRTLVSLPLAPQSTFVYHDALKAAGRARQSAGKSFPDLREVTPWGEEPALVDAFAGVINEGFDLFDPAERDRVALVLSAHSLPQRVLAAGDPYEELFRTMAGAVAAQVAPPSRPVRIAFQSQGMDGGDWLGPDLPTTFHELAKDGVQDVLIAAIGFLSDHMETLYDLDIEAKQLAKVAGLRHLERAPSLNARASLVEALALVAQRYL